MADDEVVELKQRQKTAIEDSVHDVEVKEQRNHGYSDAYIAKRGLDVQTCYSFLLGKY